MKHQRTIKGWMLTQKHWKGEEMTTVHFPPRGQKLRNENYMEVLITILPPKGKKKRQ